MLFLEKKLFRGEFFLFSAAAASRLELAVGEFLLGY